MSCLRILRRNANLIQALIADFLADRCGRIEAVFFVSLWALPGAVLQASAYSMTRMCFARVIAGVGIGAIGCVILVWSAEVSSHDPSKLDVLS